MTARRCRARTAATALVAAWTVLAACAVGSPLPRAADPVPPSSQASSSQAQVPSPSPSTCTGDVTASLRPPPVQPAPGAMPAGSYMRAIADRGFLTVAVLPDVPPFGAIDASGQFVGFDVDIARAVAAAIFGTSVNRIRFRPVINAERFNIVADGRVDMTAATATVTCKREALVDFSSVYYTAQQRVLVPLTSRARGIDDLRGQKVCAAEATTSINTIEHAPSGAIPYPQPNVADCLVALQNGTVAGVSTDDTVLAGMKAQDPYTKIVGGAINPEPYGIAINKAHPEFTRFVNGVLARLFSDGGWAALHRTWVPELQPATVPRPAYRD